VDKYCLELSTATVRNIMFELEKSGLIYQPHISAGRIPTEKGYRFYVNNLLDRYEINLREQEYIKKRLLAMQRFERALEMATQTLAERTNCAAIASAGEDIYFSGLANIFRQPDFYRYPSQALRVAEIFDNLLGIFREIPSDKQTMIYIGEESPVGKGSNCSLIISRFNTNLGTQGFLGVIGLTRMPYEKSVSLVNLITNYLEEI
jgi:transcriptional regulator of heat shock response